MADIIAVIGPILTAVVTDQLPVPGIEREEMFRRIKNLSIAVLATLGVKYIASMLGGGVMVEEVVEREEVGRITLPGYKLGVVVA